jgi:hypothetical protein
MRLLVCSIFICQWINFLIVWGRCYDLVRPFTLCWIIWPFIRDTVRFFVSIYLRYYLSNEWRVKRYYNTDLRPLKNWFLDKWRSNRPADSFKLWTAPFKGSWTWCDENQLGRTWSHDCGTKEHLCVKFDEFSLIDKISKINMTHVLARLLASVSRRINAHHVMHTLRTSSAQTQFYRYMRHWKAATHNWNIQVSGAQRKHKGS